MSEAPKTSIISIEHVPSRALPAVAGGDLTLGFSSGQATLEKGPTHWLLRWPKQEEINTIDFPFINQKEGILLQIARHLGPKAVRDLLMIYFLTWVARNKAGEPVWWFPREHLSLCGLEPNRTNLQNLKRTFEALNQVILTVSFKDGRKIVGPICSTLVKETGHGQAEDVFRVSLHPSLYEGITQQNGERGNCFLPIPFALIQHPANMGDRVHLLPIIFGPIWHQDAPQAKAEERLPQAKKNIHDLLNALGIWGNRRNYSDLRATTQLKKTLNSAVKTGLVARWWVEGGDLEAGTLEGILVAEARIIEIERPERIPNTMGEFKAWRKEQGKTQTELAEILGASQATISEIENKDSYRPLPVKVRNAVRKYIWGI